MIKKNFDIASEVNTSQHSSMVNKSMMSDGESLKEKKSVHSDKPIANSIMDQE